MTKRLNLLPKDLRPKGSFFSIASAKELFRQSATVRSAALGVALPCLLLFWQQIEVQRYSYGTQRLKKELEATRRLSAQMISDEQSLNVRRAELQSRREQLEGRRQELASARQPMVPLSTILLELVQALPDDVWLNKLDFSGDTLKVMGASQGARSVAELMNKLDSSKRFRDTVFSYTQRSKPEEGGLFIFEISTKPVFLLEPEGAG